MLSELTKGYEQIPKYHTFQKIIIPVPSESQTSADELDTINNTATLDDSPLPQVVSILENEDERLSKLKRE
jgi:hypothetical protein